MALSDPADIVHRQPVLDDGFVELKSVSGSDDFIVEAARLTSQKKGTDSRGLIRYLMRHRHTTPFEFAQMTFHVRVPMDCWRQWIRHRTASVNEYSTRYTEAIDSMQKTPPDRWRLQSQSNRQGSSGEFLPERYGDDYDKMTKPCGVGLSREEEDFHRRAREVYQARLDAGVAKEQARKDLPLSTYTEAYWSSDLHNLLHFLSLRMDSHAQYEIRQYANAIGEMVKDHFPITWEAFVDYRLAGMALSQSEVLVLKTLIHTGLDFSQEFLTEAFSTYNLNGREQNEATDKLKRLGLIKDD
jgi:thymidylate synthase (FAD)